MNEIKDTRMYAGRAPLPDVGELRPGPTLEVLAQQLSVIAAQLRGNRSPVAPPSRSAGENDESAQRRAAQTLREHADQMIDIEHRRAIFAEFARAAYASRRRRASIFADAELFGEPAWDILLDLYIAHAEKKPVSVSSACIGSAAPPTTGLRWLGVLAENDLVLREHDPEDQRRVLVRLTERGLAAMDEYFASAGLSA